MWVGSSASPGYRGYPTTWGIPSPGVSHHWALPLAQESVSKHWVRCHRHIAPMYLQGFPDVLSSEKKEWALSLGMEGRSIIASTV